VREAAAPAGETTACFDDLNDHAAKERYICGAKVVFVEHAFAGAALEVHRINPLLVRGKAVVAVRSGDATLDAQYAGAIELVADGKDLPAAVAKLLRDGDARLEAERRARAFVEARRSDVAPLCAALRTLGARALEEVAARRHAAGPWWTGSGSGATVLARRPGDGVPLVGDVLPSVIPQATSPRRRGAVLLALDATVFVAVGVALLRWNLARWQPRKGTTKRGRSHMV